MQFFCYSSILGGGGVDVNSMFSMKPLILSVLLCADAALWKYSLEQEISHILQLTIDYIYLVIVGGGLTVY